MSEIVIRRFQTSDLTQVREIFFESSTRKEFKDQNERDSFEWKYLGYYLHKYPSFSLVAEMDGKIMGYVVGASQTLIDELFKLQPHLESFKNYLSQYPAHLLINCHVDSRGKGIGSELMRCAMTEFGASSTIGVHIMTAPDSLNREFYRKLGFDFEALEDFQGSTILMMGKKLRV